MKVSKAITFKRSAPGLYIISIAGVVIGYIEKNEEWDYGWFVFLPGKDLPFPYPTLKMAKEFAAALLLVEPIPTD